MPDLRTTLYWNPSLPFNGRDELTVEFYSADRPTTYLLTGEGVTELIDELFDSLPFGEMFFPDDEITDQPIRQIVAEMIREKALKLLSEEIPHGIAVVIESFRDNENDGITDIDALIYCEKESHKGIIIGKGGSMIKKIGHDARLDIEKLLENKVFLTLNVKVKKNWRQSDILIKNFGYKKEDEA